MNEDSYLLWLVTVTGLGSRKIKALLDAFPCAEAIFTATAEELKKVDGISDRNISSIISSRKEEDITAFEKRLEADSIKFISINNAAYPWLLKQIFDPPAGLFVIGDMPDDSLPKVSVIGARRCSEYGLTVSKSLSRQLADNGIVIVSGMARGIDSMAHRGAIEGGGKTIAVLGCGVDICYPPENQTLRKDIIKHGCIISEFLPGTKPHPGNFPMRNRIISGLSQATIVTEASEKSGTLITADQALDQGRDVMAVPGNITSKLSHGTNNLIKQGCALVLSYEDVLNNMGLPKNENNKKIKNNNNVTAALAPEEKVVYDNIGFEPVDFDRLMERLNCQAYTLTYMLSVLEIRGFITKLPGQRFIRKEWL